MLQDTEERLLGEVARVQAASALLLQERDSAGKEKELAQDNLRKLNTEIHALREREATAQGGIIPEPWNLNPGA